MNKGIDAPIIPTLFLVLGVFGLIIAITTGNLPIFIIPLVMFLSALLYLHTSLRGKYIIIRNVVNKLQIPRNSQVLDLGTGHGAVLLEVAKHLLLPGQVIGIDIWKNLDQSNNSQKATQLNIDNAGFNDVAKLQTADMTSLPFNNDAFNYVFACMSIHNVKPREKRASVLREALRVLQPGGTLVIIDIEHTNEYQRDLKRMGCRNIITQQPGWIGLWGTALPTKILLAQKSLG